jgi:hypothetical protein
VPFVGAELRADADSFMPTDTQRSPKWKALIPQRRRKRLERSSAILVPQSPQ